MAQFNPYLQNVQRYARTFQVLNPDHFVNPFFYMAANTTGVAGQVVKYGAAEGSVEIAASGTQNYQVAGFLMQDVKDLDAGPVKGYRNLNNTVANLGDPVGVLVGAGNICLTKCYLGSPAVGDRLAVAKNGNGYLETYAATQTGSPIAIVEAVSTAAITSLEPTQFSSAGTAPIRIRTYNL